MLNRIGLRNFKAFGDDMEKGEARLSKVTLIYGPNSGGKSSIIQALMLLKQSLDSPRHGFKRELMIRGDTARGDVDLGSFSTLIHRHDRGNTLGFKIGFDVPNTPFVAEVAMTYTPEDVAEENSPALLSTINHQLFNSASSPSRLFEVNLNYSSQFWETSRDLYIVRVDEDADLPDKEEEFFPKWTYKSEREYSAALFSLMGMMDREIKDAEVEISRRRGLPRDEFERHNSAMLRARDLVIDLQLALRHSVTNGIVRADRDPWLERDRLVARHNVNDKLPRLLSECDIKSRFQRVEHLRATWSEIETLARRLQETSVRMLEAEILRIEQVQETYESCMRSITHLGPIRDDPQRLYVVLGAVRNFSGVRGEFTPNILFRNQEARHEVNRWFQKFGIPYNLDVKASRDVAQTGQNVYIELTDERTGTPVTLADVGFGISCILPIIVEGVASPEGSIICVEQPELHLHPRLQGHLAELIMETSKNEKGKRKQWIVETHSEVLQLSISSLVADVNNQFTAEDVSILFVQPSERGSNQGSAIIDMGATDDGQLEQDWPPDFFDEDTEYLLRTLRSQRQRQNAE